MKASKKPMLIYTLACPFLVAVYTFGYPAASFDIVHLSPTSFDPFMGYILSSWYKNIWVHLSVIVLGIVIFFIVIKLRTRYLARQKKKLEALVSERTEQIEKQKEEIEFKNRELELQNRQIQESNDKIRIQNEELKLKNTEIIAQRAQINEKSSELEKAHNELQIANLELIKVNNNLESQVEKRTTELKKAIEKLVKTDEGLNTFLYRSSHDLRGPITTLLGLIQLVEKENNQGNVQDYLRKIELSCHHMLRFLKKLNDTNLVFKSERRYEKLNWNKITSDLQIEFEKLNPGNDIKIDIENDITFRLYSDEVLIKTIIQNLVENSIMFKGKINPHVKLSLTYKHHNLMIKVRDNGIGIDPKVSDKIFDMFYRGTEVSSGNGLGLFLVKKAVELLEGNIMLNSSREFTEFRVSIPVEKVVAENLSANYMSMTNDGKAT